MQVNVLLASGLGFLPPDLTPSLSTQPGRSSVLVSSFVNTFSAVNTATKSLVALFPATWLVLQLLSALWAYRHFNSISWSDWAFHQFLGSLFLRFCLAVSWNSATCCQQTCPNKNLRHSCSLTTTSLKLQNRTSGASKTLPPGWRLFPFYCLVLTSCFPHCAPTTLCPVLS